MSGIDHLLVWGIDPRGDGINFQNKVSTQENEPFDLYSRQVTLADSVALSLPGGSAGAAVVSDGTDSAFFTVNEDGTVVLTASTGGVSAPGGGGNIQIGDIASDTSAQIRNNSGSDSDFDAFFFYR